MIKKNVRYLTGAFVVMAMLCGLYGCSSIDGSEDIGQGVIEAEDKKNTEQDSFSETEIQIRRNQIRQNQIQWNWML